MPAVLPLTFVVDGDAVVVRTRRGSRLARAAREAVRDLFIRIPMTLLNGRRIPPMNVPAPAPSVG